MRNLIDRFIDADPPGRLAIYLNDHRAGAAAGLSLARRSQKSNQGNSVGDYLADLIPELEEDREILENLIDDFGFNRNPLKIATAEVAERLGRFKTNGSLTEYSPLSRIVELEALMVGVTGRAQLWRTVGELSHYPACERIDTVRLSDRADRQRTELAELQTSWLSEAFEEDVKT